MMTIHVASRKPSKQQEPAQVHPCLRLPAFVQAAAQLTAITVTGSFGFFCMQTSSNTCEHKLVASHIQG